MTTKTDAKGMEKIQRQKKRTLDKKSRKAANKKNAKLKKLKIVFVEPAKLAPNPYNPNRQSEHEFELLCRSMEEDGFTQPVVVSSKEKTADGLNLIVDGEHRWRAGQALGMDEIPIVLVPMSKAQMRIATLRHNRARGSEDIEKVSEVMREIQELGAGEWMQDSLMLDDTEMNKLLQDIEAPDALASETYSEAWEPDKGTGDKVLTEDGKYDEKYGKFEAATSGAIAAERERDEKLAKAKSEEEKTMIRNESNVYRVYLTFSGEEGEIVKAVLGKQQAERLLALCKVAHKKLKKAPKKAK